MSTKTNAPTGTSIRVPDLNEHIQLSSLEQRAAVHAVTLAQLDESTRNPDRSATDLLNQIAVKLSRRKAFLDAYEFELLKRAVTDATVGTNYSEIADLREKL